MVKSDQIDLTGIFVVKSDQMVPHKSKMTKIPSCGVHLIIFNHKKLTELVLKDITCKNL
ncbi:hypothetical protein Hanom_Chr11g01015371 [Helianthus anomalus]